MTVRNHAVRPSAMKILYISYDGITEPIGESQVLAYLEKLAGKDQEFYLISFEKNGFNRDHKHLKHIETRLNNADIKWFPLLYRKKPPVISTVRDILSGVRLGMSIAKKNDIYIVQARSYVAGIMGGIIKKVTNCKFLFDMRGLYVDEKVDMGCWKKGGAIHKTGRKVENWLLSISDGIVVLTNAMKKFLLEVKGHLIPEGTQITVIPTCVDLDLFDINYGKPLRNFKKKYSLVYAGTLGVWYDIQAMAAFFKEILDSNKDQKVLIITQHDVTHFVELLKKLGVNLRGIDFDSCHHSEIPSKLITADAGFLILVRSFSRIGTFSTKIAEFLSLGMPVVMNSGIGDCDSILEKSKTGVLIDEINPKGFQKAIAELKSLLADSETPKRCHKIANGYLSLDRGIKLYNEVYSKI